MKSRPYPWYLRIVPNRFITWDKNGAVLTFTKRGRQNLK